MHVVILNKFVTQLYYSGQNYATDMCMPYSYNTGILIQLWMLQ